MRGTRGLALAGWAARRAAGTVLVLVGASLALFCAVRAAPGNAAASLTVLAPSALGPEADLRRQLGLDEPWFFQYGRWVSGVVRGDFGRSAALQRGRPVAELLWPAARRSLSLAGCGLALAATGALLLATLRHLRPFSRLLALSEAVSHLFSAVPVFLLAYALVSGGNAVIAKGALGGLWDLPAWFPLPARDAWLPWFLAAGVLALGDGFFLDLLQRFRGELDQASRGDHLVGARVLGLSVPAMVARSVLPGLASHVARRLSFILGSLVVLESALGWPGLGYLAWRAAGERDTPILLGVALVLALVLRVAVLAADAVAYAADPRGRGRP